MCHCKIVYRANSLHNFRKLYMEIIQNIENFYNEYRKEIQNSHNLKGERGVHHLGWDSRTWNELMGMGYGYGLRQNIRDNLSNIEGAYDELHSPLNKL